MILIVCVDDNGGMLFNKRRQSSDRAVIQEILKVTGGEMLRMNNYSRPLFPQTAPVCVEANFLLKAAPGQYCFVEDFDVEPFMAQAEKVILFCWNKSYPFDLCFPMERLKRDYRRILAKSLPGNSHEEIRMEVHVREA